jgi:spore cortex biosynthesis protein YabQ
MIQEVYVFLSAAGSGAIAGFVYDLFRLKRKALKTKAFIVGIEDIAFWIFTALLLFITAYFSNEGEVRPYFFLAAILGMYIYYWLFSRWVIKTLTFLIKVVIWPFALIIQAMKPPIKQVSVFCSKKMEQTGKKLNLQKKVISRRLKSIRNIINKV